MKNYLQPDPPEFLRGFEQRDGGDHIDTTMHRCSVLPPLPDDAHDWRMEQAEEAARKVERRYALADAAVYAIFVIVLVLVVFDRYARLLPGGA